MRRSVLALAGVTCLVLSGCIGGDWAQNARATVSETRPLAEDGRFELENANGRVEISAWDEAKVSIEATKRAAHERALEELRIEITGDASSLRVRTRYPRRHWLGGAGRVDYRVRVPRTARVKIDAVNGRVEVEGVSAPVEAATVNGSLEVRGAAGEVRASAVNGSVEVSLARLDPAGRSSLHTTNGSVRLTLPPDADADLEAHTVNGSVSCDFDLAEKSRSRHRIEGRIGAGGARFEIASVNGSVSVDRGLEARAAERTPAEAGPAPSPR